MGSRKRTSEKRFIDDVLIRLDSIELYTMGLFDRHRPGLWETPQPPTIKTLEFTHPESGELLYTLGIEVGDGYAILSHPHGGKQQVGVTWVGRGIPYRCGIGTFYPISRPYFLCSGGEGVIIREEHKEELKGFIESTGVHLDAEPPCGCGTRAAILYLPEGETYFFCKNCHNLRTEYSSYDSGPNSEKQLRIQLRKQGFPVHSIGPKQRYRKKDGRPAYMRTQ